MFRRKPGDYGGGMNVYEPRVVSCRATQEYVMVVKAPGLEHSPFASRAGCQLTVMTIAEDLCKATGSDCEAPAMFVRGQQGNWGRMVW